MVETESVREFMKRSVLQKPETCENPILSVVNMNIVTNESGPAIVQGDVHCQNCEMGYKMEPTEMELSFEILSEDANPFAPEPPQDDDYDSIL